MVEYKMKKIKKCRICGSTNLFDVIDLGKQPIPNGFLKKNDLKKKEDKYPFVYIGYRYQTVSRNTDEPGAGNRFHQQG